MHIINDNPSPATTITPDRLAAIRAHSDATQAILDRAAITGAAPLALLVIVITRLLAHVSPMVTVTSPVKSGKSDLNLLTALIGPPAASKGITEDVAAEEFAYQSCEGTAITCATPSLGTGQGIESFYTPKDGVPAPDRAYWKSTEVGLFNANASSDTSTLTAVLCQMFSGEQIGTQLAGESRLVPAHSYRFALSIHAQPDMLGAILDRQGQGFPQRLLWMPVVNRLPDKRPVMSKRDTINLRLPKHFDAPEKAINMPVADEVLDAFWERHKAQNNREIEVDDLDLHDNQLRLRLAAGLAILDNREFVKEEDWTVAGTLIDISEDTRRAAVEHLEDASADEVLAKRDAANVAEDKAMARCKAKILRFLAEAGEEGMRDVGAGQLKQKCRSDRKIAPVALDELLEAGEVVRQPAVDKRGNPCYDYWLTEFDDRPKATVTPLRTPPSPEHPDDEFAVEDAAEQVRAAFANRNTMTMRRIVEATGMDDLLAEQAVQRLKSRQFLSELVPGQFDRTTSYAI